MVVMSKEACSFSGSAVRPTFGVLHTWPGVKNAEYEVIQRIIRASENIGVNVLIVDNDGYVVDTGEHQELDRGRQITRSDCSFVLSLHFESPRLLDIFTYAALWNPLDFYGFFGYNRAIEKLASHNDVLSCRSDVADAHAANLFSSLGRDVQLPVPTFYHTVPGPYLEPKVTADSRLFYIGINWERISGTKGRHHDLLECLDDEGLIRIYGPEEFQGVRPWGGFKCYEGSIPFDGRSVLEKINAAGICLVLSSQSHQQSGIMSSRLFEALAAGAVIICNPHPLIEKYFSDCVYVIDDDVTPMELSSRIRDLVLGIRKDPAVALERAQTAQARFIQDGFGLEHCLNALFEGHSQRVANFEKQHFSTEATKVSVLLIYPGFDIEVLEKMIANVRRQRGVEINLIVMCDTSLQDRFLARIEVACLGDRLKATILHETICETKPNQPAGILRANRTNPMFAKALDLLEGDFFCIMQADDVWFEDHLTTLARTLQNHQDATFACSGRVTETVAARGRKLRHLDSLPLKDFGRLLEVSYPRDVGRFLYRASLLQQLSSAIRGVLPTLDGQEHRLLNVWAALGSLPAQSNYATYLHDEAMNLAVHTPYFPLQTQIEVIRDTVRGRSDWLLKLASTRQYERSEAELQISPRVRFDRFPRIDRGRMCTPDDVRVTEFHSSSGDGFWMDGLESVLRFELEMDTPENWLVLLCSGRNADGVEQRVSVVLNGQSIGSATVSERLQKVYFQIPQNCVRGSSLHRLELKLAHAKPVFDSFGKKIDSRKLGLNLRAFGIVDKRPALRMQLDQIYEGHTHGDEILSASTGFFHFEASAAWIDGITASIELELTAPRGQRWLSLTAAGRRSEVGRLQNCQVSLADKTLGTIELDKRFERFYLEIPDTVEGHVQLKFEAAHAEPVRDRDGAVIDARKLGVRIKSLGVVTKRIDRQLQAGRIYNLADQSAEFNNANVGFFSVENGSAWIDGLSASITFNLLPQSDSARRNLILVASGRNSTLIGASQKCTLWMNGTELAQLDLSEGFRRYIVPLPSSVAPGELQLGLQCAHAEPVTDENGIVIDRRNLGLRMQACGIIAEQPHTGLPAGKIFWFDRDNDQMARSTAGFLEVEDGAAWVDGSYASVNLELGLPVEKRRFQLVAAGRPSNGNDSPQLLTVSINGTIIGQIKLTEKFGRFHLPIPDTIVAPFARLDLTAAHAEPYLDRNGNVVDRRKLGVRVKALGISDDILTGRMQPKDWLKTILSTVNGARNVG